jgi:hypothetical protein
MASATVDIMTLRELAVLGFILWVAFFISGFIFVQRRYNLYQRLVVGMILLGIATAVCNGLLFARIYATYQRPPAIITSLSTNVYSGPGYDYLIINQLHSATELRIIAYQGIWRKFVLPDGAKGWITENMVEEI